MTTSGAHLLVVLVVDLSSSVGVGFSVLLSDLTGGAGLLSLAGTVCKCVQVCVCVCVCVCVTRTYIIYRKINTHLRQFFYYLPDHQSHHSPAI